jgi:large subunit ribosomal protein L10
VQRAEKQKRVDGLRAELGAVPGVYVVEHNGLSVKETQAIRAEMRKAGGQVRFVKNTLARIAMAGTEKAALGDLLRGANILVFGQDPVGAAKALLKVARDNGEKVRLKGGILQGQMLSPERVQAVSTLPGIDEIRARVLGVLMAVPARLVRQLTAVPQGLTRVLAARREELEKAA